LEALLRGWRTPYSTSFEKLFPEAETLYFDSSINDRSPLPALLELAPAGDFTADVSVILRHTS
jgi:hypothetical protein